MPARIVRPRLVHLSVLGAAIAAAACRGDPIAARDPDAVFGTARVAVTTLGVNADPDGFILDIRGTKQERLPTNGELSIDILEGEARLTLTDVAPNCTLNGESDRKIPITAGLETPVSFLVTCGGGGDQIVYVSNAAGEGDIQVLDLNSGAVTQLTSDLWDDSDPVWSPSDDRVAYATRSPDSTTTLIKIISASGDSLMTIGTPGTHAAYPAWAPNDDRIAFVWNKEGNFELYTINADGSNLRQLTNTTDEELRPAWSPLGDKIIFDRGDANDLNGRFLWTVSPDGSGATQLETGGTYEFHAAYSPDGKRIAFSSRRTSNTEVFVAESSGANSERLTVTGGEDGDPWWTADGLWLVFSSMRGGLRHLYKMHPDGSGIMQLTSTAAHEYDPAVSR